MEGKRVMCMVEVHGPVEGIPYYLVKLGISEQGSYLHTRMEDA